MIKNPGGVTEKLPVIPGETPNYDPNKTIQIPTLENKKQTNEPQTDKSKKPESKNNMYIKIIAGIEGLKKQYEHSNSNRLESKDFSNILKLIEFVKDKKTWFSDEEYKDINERIENILESLKSQRI